MRRVGRGSPCAEHGRSYSFGLLRADAFRPILHIEHVLTVPSFSFSSPSLLQLASLSTASSIYTKTFAAFVWAMLVDAVNVSPTLKE